MNNVNHAKNIKPLVNEVGHQYNWHYMVFVTKYGYKMSKNPKTIEIIRNALYDVAEKYGVVIKYYSERILHMCIWK